MICELHLNKENRKQVIKKAVITRILGAFLMYTKKGNCLQTAELELPL